MNQKRYRIRDRANMLPSDIGSTEFVIDPTHPEAELMLDDARVGGPLSGIPVAVFSSDQRSFTIRGRTFDASLLADVLAVIIEERRVCRRYWKGRWELGISTGLLAARNAMPVSIAEQALRSRARDRGDTLAMTVDEVQKAHATSLVGSDTPPERSKRPINEQNHNM